MLIELVHLLFVQMKVHRLGDIGIGDGSSWVIGA
jgi:hypothetical protein